ncbi:hypothetical protein [Cognatishimia activa]|uniref:hypothetical protein n=1 Tax=Cognatishimia activa TaxID=1715691 RepID=UPI00222ED580|nr:hypothetical protein [Cognatishimia activa]UZD92344.1 hypothetical protein M0D42_06970 [Cognatishimia activa]
MNFEIWVYVIAIVGGIIGSIAIIITTLKRGVPRKPKGTAPGQGSSLIVGGAGASSGEGGGTSRAYTVPKDPNEYAKAFVPSSAKDQKK